MVKRLLVGMYTHDHAMLPMLCSSKGTSSENYEANDYRHNLNLLIIRHQLCVLYPMRSGCRKKKYSNSTCLPYWSL